MRCRWKSLVVFALTNSVLLFFLSYRTWRSCCETRQYYSVNTRGGGSPLSASNSGSAETSSHDVFIGVKTTRRFHASRMTLLANTWLKQLDGATAVVVTDGEDSMLNRTIRGKLVVSGCEAEHSRVGLCCKFEALVHLFLKASNQTWFCHVDDDTYVHVDNLVRFLRGFDPKKKWYIGKPSLDHALKISVSRTGLSQSFWFATGGAGVCLSRPLVEHLRMQVLNGRFVQLCQEIRLPDDCTLGYLLNTRLRIPLTQDTRFHSHLEPLEAVPSRSLHLQFTLSYSLSDKRRNTIHLPRARFSPKDDPTRLYSLHCSIYPHAEICKR